MAYGQNQKLKEGFSLFSAQEREILIEAAEQGQQQLIEQLVIARRRARQKARSDRGTDKARRLTVGARLPRETAERYRQCAYAHGLSLYRFACCALEREYRRLTE